MIRILIADDSQVIWDCLRSLLEAQSDFEVVGVAKDGEEAVKKVKELLPDVVIMDAQMPRVGGVEATRRIKEAFPRVGVLFFSVFVDSMEESVRAGADRCLAKDCYPEELFSEARRIALAGRAAKMAA